MKDTYYAIKCINQYVKDNYIDCPIILEDNTDEFANCVIRDFKHSKYYLEKDYDSVNKRILLYIRNR